MVSGDEAFVAALSTAFAERGVETVVRAPDAGLEGAQDVALALVDLPDQGSAGSGFSTLAAVSMSTSAPLLVLAESGGLLDRVEATRHGARGFLDRSRAATELVDAALRIATPPSEAPATVLMVDDDPSALAAIRALLEPRGYRVDTVEDPTLFWERLEATAPALTIVDFDMPRISGIDLCHAIRSDPAWKGLPVLMLTAYRDADLLARAYRAGVDDFVSKPIIEDELVARIRNRLGRARAVEHGARDELTGLPARRAALGKLREALELAQGTGEQLAIALLDVDGLARVNRSYGLSAGDEDLRAI